MMKGNLSKSLGVIPVSAYIVIIIILAILDIRRVFEPPLLLPILNTLIIGSTSLIVLYVSMRSYLMTGSLNILLLGGGLQAYSLAAVIGAWLVSDANSLVTLANIGYLLGASLHFMGATLTSAGVVSEWLIHISAKLKLISIYIGVSLFIVLITIASVQDIIPPFMIPGVGPTLLRQLVLGTALVLFTVSSFLLIKLYFKSKSDLMYWYSLALAFLSLALVSYFLLRIVGDPLTWVGRSAQYLAGVYFLISVLTVIKGTRSKETQK